MQGEPGVSIVPVRERRVVAHRGGAANAPENTLAAFRKAAHLGVKWVEIDVSLLGDGTAILFHDAGLDRCTDGQGRLTEATFAEIENLDAGGWFASEFAGERIPTLAQALAEAGSLGLSINLELKRHGREGAALVDAVARIFSDSGFPPDRLFVSSFDHALIEMLRRLSPALPRGLLFKALTKAWRAIAERCDATNIIADYRRVGAAQIEAVRAGGCDAYVYTVNEPAQVEALWEAGLSGVITDCPQKFLAPPGR